MSSQDCLCCFDGSTTRGQNGVLYKSPAATSAWWFWSQAMKERRDRAGNTRIAKEILQLSNKWHIGRRRMWKVGERGETAGVPSGQGVSPNVF